MPWKFTRPVRVEGVVYPLGRIVGDDELPAGNVKSMSGVGWIVATDDTPKPKQSSAKAKPEAPAKPAAKPKAKAPKGDDKEQ